jgi:uncharacterized membrane protein
LYSYAIGTTAGGIDVVNWTNTPNTSFLRSGLGLIEGRQYYISVKARNAGGLWSAVGLPPAVIAGQASCTTNGICGVLVSPATAGQSGNPGGTVTYQVTVTNTGNTSDSFNVGVSAAWTTDAPVTVGPLAAGAHTTINVVVHIPAGAAGGASNTATITITSQGDASKSKSIGLTTTANTIRGVLVSPATAAQSGDPGGTVSYQVTVTNTGNTSDSFNVGVAAGWTADAPATVGLLAAGAHTTINVVVHIPVGAAGGASNTATITITSQGDASKSKSIGLTTTANTIRGVQVSPATAGQSGNPGGTVTYQVTVTNTGNTSDNFNVGVSAGWTTEAPGTVGPLAAGAHTTINVVVHIPAGAAGGASDTATITITSQGDASKSKSIGLTTTVITRWPVYLPVVVRQ